jgi:5S rRNA maturation endonuclease (ribonuclease M5)
MNTTNRKSFGKARTATSKFKRAGAGCKHYAVIRLAKIKTTGGLVNADRHNRRRIGFNTANIDTSSIHLNRSLIGNSNIPLDAALRAKLEGMKLRKNGNIGSELILSASPTFFKQAGALEEWVEANIVWLQEQFGDMVISADLHLDELTPHLHAIIAHEPNGKKSFKQVFGGSRNTLRDLQQGYANSMAHLGIERGEMKNEHAMHTDLADHARLVKAKLPDAPRILPKPTSPRPANNALSKWINEDESIAWQEYDNSIKARRDWVVKSFPVIAARAKTADIAVARSKQMVENVRNNMNEFESVKAIAAKVRDLDLNEVVRQFGGIEAADSKPSYASRKFILPDGREIAITKDLFVFQAEGKGGKGAIDLVMRVECCNYKEAVRSLAELFGQSATTAAVACRKLEDASCEVSEILSSPPELPTTDTSRLPKVREYLEGRGIPRAWSDYFINSGVVYADARANVVMPRTNGGAFIRGTYKPQPPAKPFKRTLGDKQCGPMIIMGDPSKVIICEGPMTALALKVIKPEHTIICKGGGLIGALDLQPYIKDAKEVLGGFDNDNSGHEFMTELKRIIPSSEPFFPPDDGYDWADKLNTSPLLAQAAPGEFAGKCNRSEYQLVAEQTDMLTSN